MEDNAPEDGPDMEQEESEEDRGVEGEEVPGVFESHAKSLIAQRQRNPIVSGAG